MNMRRWIEIRNNQGDYSPQVNGHDVAGPALYVRNLKYHAEGAIMDQIGSISFDVPLNERANLPIGIGTHILVWDSDYQVTGPVAHGIVNTKSESLSEDGDWATFAVPDLMYELSRITITSGYITPPVTGEALSTTVFRLANMKQLIFDPTSPAWAGQNDITGLDGIDFSAFQMSAYSAIDKLRAERAAHTKRGPGRTVKFGRYYSSGGTGDPVSSGIRCMKPMQGAQWTDQNPDVLLIDPTSFKRDEADDFVNDMVSTGAGTGEVQLTLKSLYGVDPSLIIGYNPAYPVKRRPRLDAGGEDTMEYYIDDPASKTANGWSMDFNPKSDIGPVSSTNVGPTDNAIFDAAVALYQASVADLIWNANPATTFTFRTLGNHDPRDLAGKTVHVFWTELTDKGDTVFTIDQDLFILSVECDVQDDGTMYWNWVLNDQGRWKNTTSGTLVGALQTINALATQPMIYPSRGWYWIEKDIAATDSTGAAMSVDLFIPGDSAVMQVLDAVFTVTPMRVISTATTTLGGLHTHLIDLPTLGTASFLGMPPHLHTTSVGPHNDHNVSQAGHGDHNITRSGHTHTGQSWLASVVAQNVNLFNHFHGMDIDTDSWTDSSTDETVRSANFSTVINGQRFYRLTKRGGPNRTINTGQMIGFNGGDLTSHTHASTASGDTNSGGGITGNAGIGGAVNTQTGYGGAINAAQSSDTNYGATGFSNVTNTNATTVTHTGGEHSHGLQYGIYQGPYPTGMTLWVDNVQITPPVDQQFTVNIAAYINDHAPHLVSIKAASLGRVQVVGNVKRKETTFALAA